MAKPISPRNPVTNGNLPSPILRGRRRGDRGDPSNPPDRGGLAQTQERRCPHPYGCQSKGSEKLTHDHANPTTQVRNWIEKLARSNDHALNDQTNLVRFGFCHPRRVRGYTPLCNLSQMRLGTQTPPARTDSHTSPISIYTPLPPSSPTTGVGSKTKASPKKIVEFLHAPRDGTMFFRFAEAAARAISDRFPGDNPSGA
jgi:hypothetical protein